MTLSTISQFSPSVRIRQRYLNYDQSVSQPAVIKDTLASPSCPRFSGSRFNLTFLRTDLVGAFMNRFFPDKPFDKSLPPIPSSYPERLKKLFRAAPTDINIDAFSVPMDGAEQKAGNPKVGYFERPVQLGDKTINWGFTHRNGAACGAVHALTLVEDENGKVNVHFVVEEKPPMGGQQTIQLPAGVMDKNVSVMQLGLMEASEETPFKPIDARVLSTGPIVTSPGITTEQKGFIVVRAQLDKEKASQDHREAMEQVIMKDGINLPLEDFLDNDKYHAWVKQQEAEGRKICLDIPVARSYLL